MKKKNKLFGMRVDEKFLIKVSSLARLTKQGKSDVIREAVNTLYNIKAWEILDGQGKKLSADKGE